MSASNVDPCCALKGHDISYLDGIDSDQNSPEASWTDVDQKVEQFLQDLLVTSKTRASLKVYDPVRRAVQNEDLHAPRGYNRGSRTTMRRIIIDAI